MRQPGKDQLAPQKTSHERGRSPGIEAEFDSFYADTLRGEDNHGRRRRWRSGILGVAAGLVATAVVAAGVNLLTSFLGNPDRSFDDTIGLVATILGILAGIAGLLITIIVSVPMRSMKRPRPDDQLKEEAPSIYFAVRDDLDRLLPSHAPDGKASSV